MPFQLRLTREAEEDLEQLFDFIIQRELDRNKNSDLQMAQAALDAIERDSKP
jgi:plasmid stabilization system protein ParE